MRYIKMVSVLVALFAICAALAPKATATDWDKKTLVTFANSVEVPGAILPAGTYEFVLAAPHHNRSVIQIWNEDHTKLYTTFIAINNYRHRATEDTVITFSERPRGRPDAVHEWFYPGDKFGKEFVYPEERALQLAKDTNEPVLAMPTELTPDMTAPIRTPDQSEAMAMEQSKVVAVTPEQKEEPIAEAIEVEPPVQQIAQLPKTASYLPTILLVGLLCLGLGFALRRAPTS